MNPLFILSTHCLFLGAMNLDSAPPVPVQLRARAALALAFADVKPKQYAEQYTRAVKEQKPLIVWVGQPMQQIPGCFSVRCESFPGVQQTGVVIGLPFREGRLRRVDLTGPVSQETLFAAIRSEQGSDVMPFETRWVRP